MAVKKYYGTKDYQKNLITNAYLIGYIPSF